MDQVVLYDNCEDNNYDDDDDDEKEDVDLLGYCEDDEPMDEEGELREAMRQSLLEHKKQEIAREAMKHDTLVDILVSDNEKEKEYLPCRPEPYLRQMINTAVEEDETEEDDEKQDNGEKSESTSTSGETSKIIGKDEAQSAKALLVRQSLTTAVFVSHVLDIMPNMQKPKPLEEDCLSFTTTKVVVAVNPVLPARPGRGRKSRAANMETMLKASINPYLHSMMLSKQGVAVPGQGSRLKDIKNNNNVHGKRPSDVAAKTKFSVVTQNDESYSSETSRTGLATQCSISPREAPNDDEAAVALGLLGLSPCHNTNGRSNSSAFSDSKEPVIGPSATIVSTKESPSASAAVSSAPAEAPFSSFSFAVKNESDQVVTTSTSASSSDRDSPVVGPEDVKKQYVEKSKLSIIDNSCSACRGRLVIHSCGRRSLPIDYEELDRVARARKEKEEEEKKRVRAEKRRFADQRRREAKKQKQRELEEQRQREEKVRLDREESLRLQEDFASQDHDQERRHQIVASYANHSSNLRAGPNESETAYQTNQSGTYSAQNQTSLSVPSGQPSEQVAYSRSAQSPMDALLGLANLADHTETLPVKETITSTGICAGTAASNSTDRSNYSSYGYATATDTASFARESATGRNHISSFSTSHGFEASPGLDESGSDEAWQRIPSYATIRGQSNGQNDGATSAMTNSAPATTSYANGYSHQTWKSQSYLSNTRPEDHNQR